MLLDDLKSELKITWNDEDAKLDKIISKGKAFIQGLTGTTLDFEIVGEPNTLLLEYCRYDYNNAVEYFEENFSSRLMRLQYTEEIKAYKAENLEEGS